LEKEVNKHTGLKLEISYLSPLLNAGFTIENFNLVGKILEERYLLHIYDKAELIRGQTDFKILTEISSYPWEFFVFKDFVIFFNIVTLRVIKCNVWERVFKNLKHII
jgi:hypothetical protein